MKKYFYLDESPVMTGHYTIRITDDNFPFKYGINVCYSIMCARFANLDYPDYLRYCRDVLGATLISKGSKYPTAYFKKTKEVEDFVKILNKRVDAATSAHAKWIEENK